MHRLKHRIIWIFAQNVPKSVRYNFFVDLLGSAVMGIGLGFFMPYFPLLARQEFNANEFLLGLLTAGAYAGGIAALFSGGIVRPGKEKQWYCTSLVAARAMIFVVACSTGGFMYCFMVFGMNLLLGLFVPQYSIIIQKIYPIEYRGRLMGYVRLVGAGANLVGAVISGLFMKNPDNWQAVFVVSGVLCTAAAAISFWFRVPETEKNLPGQSMLRHLAGAFRTLGTSRNNLKLILLMPLYSFATQIIALAAPITQADKLHLKPSDMAIASGVQFVMWMLGFVYWGRYIDRFSATRAFVLHMFIAVIWPLAYFMATGIWAVAAAQGVYGFIIACNELGFFNVKLEITEKGKDNEYQALHAFASGLRCFLGVVFAVYLTNAAKRYGIDIRLMFLLAAALLLICGVSLMPLVSERQIR